MTSSVPERWYVQVLLESLHTTESGSSFHDKGEWYMEVNGQRFPSKGYVKLGKNDTFTPPEPKPTLWTTISDRKDDPLRVEMKVEDKALVKDNVMLEGQVNVFWETKDQVFELKSRDGKITTKVRIITQLNKAW